jgi:isoleucyl-tRNA synthetase
VNYTRLDEFDPNGAPIPVAERPEIDRWILSNLQELLAVAHEEMPKYNVAEFCRVAAQFLDDLTNWYIRRNRRRFWRSKDTSDTDKTAAYQTLYTVLVTLSKALAPCIPFLTERMYQNLVVEPAMARNDDSVPGSVHLCDYPECDLALLDSTLGLRTSTAQLVVKLGHKLREEKNLRVRLPLTELQFACSNDAQREAVEYLGDVIKEELNIKTIAAADNLDSLVSYSYKPNLKTLGPKYGKLLGTIRTELPAMDPSVLAPLRSGESVTVEFNGESVELGPGDVMVSTEQATDWACGDEAGVQIAIATIVTPELEREGMARDFVRQVQQLRKNHDLEIQDRITINFSTDDDNAAAAIAEWNTYICEETQADSISAGDAPSDSSASSIGQSKVSIWL